MQCCIGDNSLTDQNHIMQIDNRPKPLQIIAIASVV